MVHGTIQICCLGGIGTSYFWFAYKHDTNACQEFMELKNQKEFACSICYGVEVIDTDISFTIEPYEEFIQNQNP